MANFIIILLLVASGGLILFGAWLLIEPLVFGYPDSMPIFVPALGAVGCWIVASLPLVAARAVLRRIR